MIKPTQYTKNDCMHLKIELFYKIFYIFLYLSNVKTGNLFSVFSSGYVL